MSEVMTKIYEIPEEECVNKIVHIRYWSKKINDQLDNKLTELMESCGYEKYATGYHLVEKYRDLCFELKDETIRWPRWF